MMNTIRSILVGSSITIHGGFIDVVDRNKMINSVVVTRGIKQRGSPEYHHDEGTYNPGSLCHSNKMACNHNSLLTNKLLNYYSSNNKFCQNAIGTTTSPNSFSFDGCNATISILNFIFIIGLVTTLISLILVVYYIFVPTSWKVFCGRSSMEKTNRNNRNEERNHDDSSEALLDALDHVESNREKIENGKTNIPLGGTHIDIETSVYLDDSILLYEYEAIPNEETTSSTEKSNCTVVKNQKSYDVNDPGWRATAANQCSYEYHEIHLKELSLENRNNVSDLDQMIQTHNSKNDIGMEETTSSEDNDFLVELSKGEEEDNSDWVENRATEEVSDLMGADHSNSTVNDKSCMGVDESLSHNNDHSFSESKEKDHSFIGFDDTTSYQSKGCRSDETVSSKFDDLKSGGEESNCKKFEEIGSEVGDVAKNPDTIDDFIPYNNQNTGNTEMIVIDCLLEDQLLETDLPQFLSKQEKTCENENNTKCNNQSVKLSRKKRNGSFLTIESDDICSLEDDFINEKEYETSRRSNGYYDNIRNGSIDNMETKNYNHHNPKEGGDMWMDHQDANSSSCIHHVNKTLRQQQQSEILSSDFLSTPLSMTGIVEANVALAACALHPITNANEGKFLDGKVDLILDPSDVSITTIPKLTDVSMSGLNEHYPLDEFTTTGSTNADELVAYTELKNEDVMRISPPESPNNNTEDTERSVVSTMKLPPPPPMPTILTDRSNHDSFSFGAVDHHRYTVNCKANFENHERCNTSSFSPTNAQNIGRTQTKEPTLVFTRTVDPITEAYQNISSHREDETSNNDPVSLSEEVRKLDEFRIQYNEKRRSGKYLDYSLHSFIEQCKQQRQQLRVVPIDEVEQQRKQNLILKKIQNQAGGSLGIPDEMDDGTCTARNNSNYPSVRRSSSLNPLDITPEKLMNIRTSLTSVEINDTSTKFKQSTKIPEWFQTKLKPVLTSGTGSSISIDDTNKTLCTDSINSKFSFFGASSALLKTSSNRKVVTPTLLTSSLIWTPKESASILQSNEQEQSQQINIMQPREE